MSVSLTGEMMEKRFDPFVQILKIEFANKKMRNKAYSLRAFARHLNMDSSNLAKILNDQMIPGEKLREKIAKKIGFEAEDFSQLFKYRKTHDADYSHHDFEIFNIVSDWHHYAILEAIKLKRYRNKTNLQLLAADLGLSRQKVQEAIDRMINVGLLKRNGKQDELENTSDSSSSILATTSSKAHRNQQKQILEMAISALEEIPLSKRSQSSMTMAINRKKLPQALHMIKEFRRKLARFLSEDQQLDDVYHLSISLYPITNTINNKEQL